MTEFERDVIDRLARIETEAKGYTRFGETLVVQGTRLDAATARIGDLEKSLAQLRDRAWGVLAIAVILIPQLVTYLKLQIFGPFTIPH